MHLDNLLFVLLGLAFVVLRWLVQRATKPNGDRRRDAERPARAPAQSDEERVRSLMEALGNPVGSKPPPKVTPRPVQPTLTASAEPPGGEAQRQIKQPRKSIWTGPLPPLTTTPPPPPPPRRVIVPQSVAGTATPPVRVAAAAPRTQPIAQREFDLQALLGSPGATRNAVVLREVLGPPRSVQPLDCFADRVI